MGKWDRAEYRRTAGVRKSIEARESFNEECKTLRMLPFRRDGRYWRAKISSLSKRNVEISAAKFEKGKLREERRKKWLYEKSYLKLPRSYLEHSKDTFKKYCMRCKIMGHCTVFYLIVKQIDPEMKRVIAFLNSKLEVKYDFFGLKKSFEAGVIPAIPHRNMFVNYKKWQEATDIYWKMITMISDGKLKHNVSLSDIARIKAKKA